MKKRILAWCLIGVLSIGNLPVYAEESTEMLAETAQVEVTLVESDAETEETVGQSIESTEARSEEQTTIEEIVEAREETAVEENFENAGSETIIASGACGEHLTWTLNTDGVLSINGHGVMDDYSYLEAPWVEYRNKIKKLNVAKGVTSIGDYAFYDCELMTSVRLPNSIEDIGADAFRCCYLLSDFTWPSSLKTIGDRGMAATALTGKVVLPEGLSYIGESAFGGAGMQSIEFPKSVKHIGKIVFDWHDSSVFMGCQNLTEVILNGDAPEISGDEFFEFPLGVAIQLRPENLELVISVPAGAKGYDRKPWSNYKVFYRDAPQVSQTEIEIFTTRLYKVCLGRTPDKEGLKTWADLLEAKEATGVSAAYGFVFSNEFKAKNLCNEDYVEQLYEAFMGRKADASGKSTWVNLLESGTTREEVFNGFALSKEFEGLCNQYGIEQGKGIEIPKFGTIPTDSCSICGKEDGVTGFVTRLYQVCLNRKPDAGGLKDWRTRLCEHTSSGREVAYGFIFSQEFINKKYSNADYVEHLYEAFMGRGSDAAGKKMWVDLLNTGWTREQVFDGFVGSQEFTGICNSYGIVRD